MIYASDFRKGVTFDINGDPHVVIDFQHVKPGKGAALIIWQRLLQVSSAMVSPSRWMARLCRWWNSSTLSLVRVLL